MNNFTATEVLFFSALLIIIGLLAAVEGMRKWMDDKYPPED